MAFLNQSLNPLLGEANGFFVVEGCGSIQCWLFKLFKALLLKLNLTIPINQKVASYNWDGIGLFRL